jgi:hypothetical protein
MRLVRVEVHLGTTLFSAAPARNATSSCLPDTRLVRWSVLCDVRVPYLSLDFVEPLPPQRELKAVHFVGLGRSEADESRRVLGGHRPFGLRSWRLSP